MAHDKDARPEVSRRNAFAVMGAALAGGAFACLAVTTQAQAGYGACTSCSCPGFVAANNWPQVCQRCAHSWHVHR